MRLFFSVGEPSGDLHGSNLIRALRSRQPNLECVGYGGPKMKTAGCELHADLMPLAVMGFGRVFANLGKFFELRDRAKRYFERSRPTAVVLIDYPGFNWHIAAAARAHDIPVYYYGTPQVWGWAQWRVSKMRRWVNHVLCKLPFEPAWFRKQGVAAEYVGHPYYDELANLKPNTAFMRNMTQPNSPLVTILPGSRSQEIENNLPAFLKAAREVRAQLPQVRFAIAAYNDKQAAAARRLAAADNIEVHVGRTQELIQAAHCCLACSGSVSLELLWHAKPTVIHYKTHWANYFAQYLCRRVKHITLVNLLAEEDIFTRFPRAYDPHAEDADRLPMPEYLCWQDRSSLMTADLVRWLTDPAEYARRVGVLQSLRARFAQVGASEKAAAYILHTLNETSRIPPPHFAGKLSLARVV